MNQLVFHTLTGLFTFSLFEPEWPGFEARGEYFVAELRKGLKKAFVAADFSLDDCARSPSYFTP